MALRAVTAGQIRLEIDIGTNGTALLNGREIGLDIRRTGKRAYSVLINGRSVRVVVTGSHGQYQALVGSIPIELKLESERDRLMGQFTRRTPAVEGRAEVRAPMPAMVVRVEVAPGEAVEEGRGLIVLEAMKMENEIRADRAGTVREIVASPGSAVEKGALLLVLE